MNSNHRSIFRQGVPHISEGKEHLRYPFSYLRYYGEYSNKFHFDISSEVWNYMKCKKKKKRIKSISHVNQNIGINMDTNTNIKKRIMKQKYNTNPVVLLNSDGSDNDAIIKAAEMLGLKCVLVPSDNLNIMSDNIINNKSGLIEYDESRNQHREVGDVQFTYMSTDGDSGETLPVELIGNLWIGTIGESSKSNQTLPIETKITESESQNLSQPLVGVGRESDICDSTKSLSISKKKKKKQKQRNKQKGKKKALNTSTNTNEFEGNAIQKIESMKPNPKSTENVNINRIIENTESKFTSTRTQRQKYNHEYGVTRPFYSMSDSHIFASIYRRIISRLFYFPQLDMPKGDNGCGISTDRIITGDPSADEEAYKCYYKYYNNNYNHQTYSEEKDVKPQVTTRMRASSSVIGDNVTYDPLFQQHYTTLKIQRQRERQYLSRNSVINNNVDIEYGYNDSDAYVQEVDEDKLHYSYLVRSFDVHPLMYGRGGLF